MTKKPLIQFLASEKFSAKLEEKLIHFDHSKKTLLIIEPYGSVNALLRRALARSYQVIVLTANSDLRMVSQELLEAVQLAIQVDTADEKKLRALVEILRRFCVLDGVIPGFEYFVPLASKLSQTLQVPGLCPTKVMNLRSKDLMRLTLEEAGLAGPKFFIIKSMEDLPAAIEKVGFPAICKPIDAAGSVNVKKVTELSEAVVAASRILQGEDVLWGHKLAQSLLFEEYIEGKEYSVEGVIQNGHILHFSITEKFVADQREFIEIGHIANVPLDPELKVRIESYLEQVINTLYADNCPFHAELRVNSEGQPILMEIAARLAGDRIGDLINLACDLNYYDAVLATYLGTKVRMPAIGNAYAGIRFFYRPQLEAYSEVQGLVEAKKLPIEELCLYYESKQPIPDFPKPLRRLGHVIMKNDNYDYLVKTLNIIDQNLVFAA